ncbi:MAG: Leucine-rich repeat (LRR) protein [Arenicella sp.]|jgi:Leucine-rich repeat (LRR) protein
MKEFLFAFFMLTISTSSIGQKKEWLGLCQELNPSLYSQNIDTLYIENGQGYCESYAKVLDERISKLKNLVHLTYIGYAPYFHGPEVEISLPKEISELPKLRYLRTRYLNHEIFGLSNIETLNLGCSSYDLKYFEKNSFSKLNSLRHLTLAFVQTPDSAEFKGIRDLENLESIVLVNPSQQLIDECLANRNLKSIKISRTKDMKFDFSKTLNIEFVSLEFNELTEVPESIYALKKLKNLLLGWNVITEISRDIDQLSNLENINFLFNKLSSIPDEITKCSKLKTFNFRGNRDIIQLPEDLGDLKEMTEFDVSECTITTLPKSLKNCSKLISFEAKKNKLVKLDLDFSGMLDLKDLNVESNKITFIDPTLFQLEKVEQLDLNNNKLTILAESIGNMKSLEDLNIFYNNLTELPNDIGNLTELVRLSAYQNSITTLPSSLCKLQNLRAMHFGNNEIKRFPENLDNLKSLQNFELQSNPLKKFPKEIYKIKSIHMIWVSQSYRLLPGFKAKKKDPEVIFTR